MRKQKPFYVSLYFLILFLSFPTALLAKPKENPSLKNFINFRLFATNPKECILFSPNPSPLDIEIFKRSTSKKALFKRPQGTRCKILDTEQWVTGEVWFKIELVEEKSTPKEKPKSKFNLFKKKNAEEMKIGWVKFDKIVTAPSITILGEGRNVFLEIKPQCETEPCPPKQNWLITPVEQRTIELGDSHYTFDRDGKFIFYDTILREKSETGTGNVFWRSYIYRYDIALNQLKKLGMGLAPVAHPKKDLILYRNLSGKVLASDYSFKFVRTIYEPEKNPALGQYYYSDPGNGILPTPIKFLNDRNIRVEVIYGQGKMKKKVDISLDDDLAQN